VPVKGTYLAIAGGGAILLWSGLRGKGWSTVLRDVIAGKNPAQAPSQNAIAGTPASAFSSTSNQSFAGTGGGQLLNPVAPSASETAVMTAICAALGAPPTKANLLSLSAWRQHECPWNAQPPDGAQYTHNPFNTTLATGSTGTVNSVGVRIYPNWAVGIAATVATINGGYPIIKSRLRSGAGLCGLVSVEFSQWSGNGYDSVC
jgi:hypothetical protein